MTRDDIIRMAREAGLERVVELREDGTRTTDIPHPDLLKRFADLVAAKERDSCAALAEKTICDTHIPTNVKIYGSRAAAAIRSRGET